MGLKNDPSRKGGGGGDTGGAFEVKLKTFLVLSNMLPFRHKDTTLKNRKVGCEFTRKQSLK